MCVNRNRRAILRTPRTRLRPCRRTGIPWTTQLKRSRLITENRIDATGFHRRPSRFHQHLFHREHVREHRLGRDVEKIARLIKSDVEIIVTDNPHATRFTIHILAAVAEEQRQRIRENTKDALAAARKRGVVLGKNGKRLAKQNKQAAQIFARQLLPVIEKLRNQGITTFRGIAEELNHQGVPTFRGNAHWHVSTVFALIHRLPK